MAKKWLLTLLTGVFLFLLVPAVYAGFFNDVKDTYTNVFTSKQYYNNFDVRIKAEKEIIWDSQEGYVPVNIENLNSNNRNINLGLTFEDGKCEVLRYEALETITYQETECIQNLITPDSYLNKTTGLKENPEPYYKDYCYLVNKEKQEWVEVSFDNKKEDFKTSDKPLKNKEEKQFRAFVYCEKGTTVKYSISVDNDLGKTFLDPTIEINSGNFDGIFVNTIVSGIYVNLSDGQTSGVFQENSFGLGYETNWTNITVEVIKPSGETTSEYLEANSGPIFSSYDALCGHGTATRDSSQVNISLSSNCGKITTLELIPSRAGTPDGSIIVAIQGDSSDNPDGVVQYYSNVTPLANDFETFTPYNFTFTNAINLENQHIHFVISKNGTLSGSNHVVAEIYYNSVNITWGENDTVNNWNYPTKGFYTRVYCSSSTPSNSDVTCTACFSEDNITFGSCIEQLETNPLITNETAGYMNISCAFSRDETDLNPALKNLTVDYEESGDIAISYPSAEIYTYQITELNYSYNFVANTCWYSLDLGDTNNTITCGDNVEGITSTEGENIWKLWINSTGGTEFYDSVTFSVDTIPPVINLEYPENTTYYNNVTELNYTFIETNPDACWYSLDLGDTNNTITCGDNVTGISSVEGSNTWQVGIRDTAGQETISEISLYVDFVVPTTPTIIQPDNNSNFTGSPVTLECDSTSILGAVTYEYETSVNSLFTEYNSFNSTDTQNITYTLNNYTDQYFRCRARNIYDRFSNYSEVRFYVFDNRDLISSNSVFTEPVLTTTSQNYYLNITVNPYLVDNVVASLDYNQTPLSVSKRKINSTTYEFSASTIVPYVSVNTTKVIDWNINLTYLNATEVYYNSTEPQEINPILFYNCTGVNLSAVTHVLNITFADESTDTQLNASIPTSTFEYSLDSGFTQSATYSFTTLDEQFEYDFCISPSYAELYTKTQIQYESTNYPQRTYQQTLTLSDDTTNKTLYLIQSGSGAYITFQVVNSVTQTLSDAYVQVEKQSDGTYVFIEAEYTDSAGSASFYLDQDQQYRITITKSGYVTYVLTLIPSQTQYTITLESSSPVTNENYYQGIEFSLSPNETILNNGTEYNFSFDISSTYFALDYSGFTLVNSSGAILGSGFCEDDPLICSSSSIINPLESDFVTMNYYWFTNNSYTNGTNTWWVQSTYTGAYSLKNTFFQDVRNLGSGMNDFTKALLSFILIMIVVISLRMKTDIITSALPMMIVITAMVGILDFLFGWIPSLGIVDHFIFIVTVLITISIFIWENR